MRRLGISIYPEVASLEENMAYALKASRCGFDRIFTCLLSVEGDKETIISEFKTLMDYCKGLGFEIIVDVAPGIFKDLGIRYDDLSFFKEMGVDGLRLDEGFTGLEEAMMTYNEEGLMIELNVSQPNYYLENILSYEPDSHMLIGCHNFYPMRRTGLDRELFLKNSRKYKEKGIRVAAFITAKEGPLGPWNTTDGLCTLEEHRDLEDITVQARDLWNTGVVDDVIIGNCFASDEELEALGGLRRGLLVLDLDLETELSDTEKDILFDELHFHRGDHSEYFVRSTMPRVKYRDHHIPKNNARDISRGDIIIKNHSQERYKGELHIALKDFENDGSSNVIGRVREDNMFLIDTIKPWQKFSLQS